MKHRFTSTTNQCLLYQLSYGAYSGATSSISQKDLEQEHKPRAVISADRPSEKHKGFSEGKVREEQDSCPSMAWQAEAVAFISPWSSAFSPCPSAHSRHLYLIKNFQQAGPAALLGAKCHI